MGNNSYLITDNISDVYKSLLPDFFQRPFPHEDSASCDHCVMISDDRGKLGPGLRGFLFNYSTFHPVVKCCTHQPDLPNFLVGAILCSTSNELSEGRKRIKEKIIQGEGVTPQGIHTTESESTAERHLTDYNSDSADSSTGIGCPFFNQDNKNCSIWLFRPANCSTYFCKSVEGIAGRLFWDAMNFYFSNVENQISHYILSQLGLSSKSEMWQQDKFKFYIESYKFVKGLDRAKFEDMCGPDLHFLLENLHSTYIEAIRSTVPEKLKKNPVLQYEKLDNSQYLYNTSHGRCILSNRLHGFLSFFDGNMSNEQVMERILEEQEVSLTSDFLLRLYKSNNSVEGFMEDYSLVIKSFIDLYKATFNQVWLNQAVILSDKAEQLFFDGKSDMYFYTSVNENVVVRKMEITDNVIPSSNAIMAQNLYDLSIILEDDSKGARAIQMAKNTKKQSLANPNYSYNWLQLMLRLQSQKKEVVIIGKNAQKEKTEFLKNYYPTVVIIGSETANEASPLLKNRFQTDKTLFYYCVDNTCKMPVDNISEIIKLIK